MLPRAGLVTPEFMRDHILPHIIYRDTQFQLYPLEQSVREVWALAMQRPVIDTNNPGRQAVQMVQKLLYGPVASEDDALAFIFEAIMEMETHEAREWFHYLGERIYDPHK